MNQIPYTPASFKANGFNCPFCNAYSKQEWGLPVKIIDQSNYGRDENLAICRCNRCCEFSIWVKGNMVYPNASSTTLPNQDLPEDIKVDYEEARTILMGSPRGSAALLRLAIQKLCNHLGEKGKNISEDIGFLVKKGLPVKIQQALDIVRVVGNNSVHPGQIDLKDNVEVANKLFNLVNLIAEVMITQPKHIESMYNDVVPESQRDAIEKRDNS